MKFAFVSGLLGGGVCTALSGFLEFFEPGTLFVVMSVLIRSGRLFSLFGAFQRDGSLYS